MSDKMSLEQAQKIFDEYIVTCRCNKCKAVKMIIAHHQQREIEARDAALGMVEKWNEYWRIAKSETSYGATAAKEVIEEFAKATLEKFGGAE